MNEWRRSLPTKEYFVLHMLGYLSAPQLAGLVSGMQVVTTGAVFGFLILITLGLLP